MSSFFNFLKDKNDNFLGIKMPKKSSNLMTKLQRIDTVKTGASTPEDNYLMIDDKNNFNEEEEFYKDNIDIKFVEFKKNDSEKLEATNKIMNKLLEKKVANFGDIFEISQSIAKRIARYQKIDRDSVEVQLNTFINKAEKINKYKKKSLHLTVNICKTFSIILSYTYSKMSNYKVKDMKKLVDIRKKIIKGNIDIFKDFINFCQAKKKFPQNEKLTSFCKDKRDKYEILPEIIFIINKYSNVNIVEIDLKSFTTLTEEELDSFEITILNIYWLLNSLDTIKFNFISEDLERSLYLRYNSIVMEKFEINQESPKLNYLIYNYDICQNKWNFIDNYKIKEYKEIANEPLLYSHKSFDLSSNAGKMMMSKTVAGLSALKRNTFMDLSPLIKKDDDKQNRLDIVKNNVNILELMVISLYSLNNCQNNFKLELIINDSLIFEFILAFKKIYNMDWITRNYSEFHLFDIILYNQVMKNIQKLNIEINSLDPLTFDKLLHILYYNDSLISINLSLFSADISYLVPFIFKIFEGSFSDKILRKNEEDCTYLFNDIKDIEEKMINSLSYLFIYHLSVLFHIIKKKKNLNELGFNLDIPSNINQNQKIMNAIFKFILNLLFYLSNSYINKFRLLCPSILIDCRNSPEINDLIDSIDLINKNTLEELSLQMQFYKILNIKNFITPTLKILNIGDLDLLTLKSLCNYICNPDFNKNSALEKLTIGIMNVITDFSFDIKLIFEKLFKIKIQNFVSLSIFTNIEIINKYQYLYLLKILNNNWISEYRITFNKKSQIIINENKDKINELNYIVPHNLEGKLLEDKDLLNIGKNNNAALKEINKNSDLYDESYWSLKYLFDKRYTDNLKNEERNKQIIFDILKYIYFIKKPKIFHVNETKNNN